MTIDEIKQALHKADLTLRPNILVNRDKHFIANDNIFSLGDIKSAVQLLHIYQRLFIFNQKSHKGA